MGNENTLRDSELRGGTVREVWESWMKNASYENTKTAVLVPKWKWFKPPRWKIFLWAYDLKYVPNVTAVELDQTSFRGGSVAMPITQYETRPRWKWFRPPHWEIFSWAYITCPKENRNKRKYSADVLKRAIDEMNGRPEMNQKWTGEPDRLDRNKDMQIAYFCPEEDHTLSIILETVSPELTPRWSWFKPPKWRIFSWAYHHEIKDAVKFVNCYPSSTGGTSSDSPKEFAVKFTANPWKPPEDIVKKVSDALSHNKEVAEEESNVKVSKQAPK